MRVTEVLMRQNMKKKNNPRQAEEEEETQAYKEQKQEYWSINRAKNAFASPMDEGLNNRESVFDRQAVFRTKQ